MSAEPTVTVERGAGLLVLPIRDGVGDLAECRELNASAARIWTRMRDGEDVDTIAEALADEHDLDLERARCDVTAVACASTATDERDDTSDDRDAPVDADWVEAIARAVLAAGHRLRFVAHGDSMRPMIPAGTPIEAHAADIDDMGVGDVALYRTGSHPLVAHRVVRKKRTHLVTRGDSSGRVDEVHAADLLGRVEAAVIDGRRKSVVDRSPVLRLSAGPGRRGARVLRGPIRWSVEFGCRTLRFVERRAARGLRRLEIVRAALMSPADKDDQRARLYAGKAVQTFTALDENVEAGLTLIEEVALARHEIEPGRALVLGCGPGRESFALAERGFTVTAIDREPAMLEHAQRSAAARGLSIDFRVGAADAFDLDARFDTIVVFSGLYNMLLPRRRRVAALSCCARHLTPHGRVIVTFLSAYVPPGDPPARRRRSWLQVASPEHEDGDRFLLNEAVHVFPHPDALCDEVRAAGLRAAVLWRDQRAYDRADGLVRGYAILEHAPETTCD